MERDVDVAVIGAGTAGLSAVRVVGKASREFVLIDSGPLGTTCARVGCMPSKVLIHCANQYFARHSFDEVGILGGAQVGVDLPTVLAHVRRLRDRFAGGVVKSTQAYGERLIQGQAVFFVAEYVAGGRSDYSCQEYHNCYGGS